MPHHTTPASGAEPLSSLDPLGRSRLLPNTPVTLLQRIRRSSDPAAWADLVQLLVPLVDLWVRRTIRDRNDRADVGQDVFLELARRLPTWDYDAGRSFRGWLRTVTRTKCVDFFRKRGHVAPPDDVPAAEVADPLAQAENALLLRSALNLLRSQVRPDLWAIFQQYVLDEQPAPAVAAACGVELNYVYLVRSRLLARLRNMLESIRD